MLTFFLKDRAAYFVALCVGIPLGTGIFIGFYANALSYAGSEPEVCANCHIMQTQFDSWQKSSHHAAATCIDCHLPHNIIGKYAAKALNGYHHSKAFTLQNFHEPIMIKPGNSAILQHNCIRCHAGMVHSLGVNEGPDAVHCVHCHRTPGHGDVLGLGGPQPHQKESP